MYDVRTFNNRLVIPLKHNHYIYDQGESEHVTLTQIFCLNAVFEQG